MYLPGNWQVPFGLVLVVDRLSALMLVLTGIIGVCALLFAMARWDGAGSSFHALFQIQLMGLYGAFLTATCSTCSCFSKCCWPRPTA